MALNKEQRERNVLIFKAYLDGESCASIGRRFDIGRERVSQIPKQWFRMLNHPRYKEMVAYPMPRETHPHLWEEIYPGGFFLDRKKLKPEEVEQDKAHWLKLLEFYLQRNQ